MGRAGRAVGREDLARVAGHLPVPEAHPLAQGEELVRQSEVGVLDQAVDGVGARVVSEELAHGVELAPSLVGGV